MSSNAMVLLPVVIEPLSLAGQTRCVAAAQRIALRFYPIGRVYRKCVRPVLVRKQPHCAEQARANSGFRQTKLQRCIAAYLECFRFLRSLSADRFIIRDEPSLRWPDPTIEKQHLCL